MSTATSVASRSATASGEFRATFGVEDVTLDYLAGFTPLRGGRGRVEIVNGGLRGELDTGQVGGLSLEHGSVTIADLKAPVIEVNASGSGDLGEALRMLQASPLGPVIGRPFMQLAGRGDTGFELRLHLPTAAMAEHDYEVRARLRSASVSVPWLRAPAQDVSGGLEIHRRSLRSEDLHGNFLGGPFAVTVASPESTASSVESVTVAGHGRVAGTLLPGFIGLPAGIRMSGGADWKLDLAARRESKGQPWPLQLAVTSDLLGLAIDAPPPFAKTADDDRPTALRLTRNADDSDLDIRSGSAHARLVFLGQGGRLEFDRGALRFDGGSLALPARAGLRIDGDWPDFDLGSWLALGGDGPARRALSDWLGPVNVQLARVRLFGHELRDVAAVLETTGREWQAELSGPDAEGRVTVPFDPRGGAPIVLDMRRLRLESAAPTPGPTAAGRPAASADPRRLPALSVSAQDFVWQGRRLGQLRAEVVRDAMGLRLQKFSSNLPELSVNATGSWLVEGSGSQSSVEVQASSNDLAAASVALGYRSTIEAKRTELNARLRWPGGPRADAVSLMDGDVHLDLQDGQLRNVEPGAAGRVLGLMSRRRAAAPARARFPRRHRRRAGVRFGARRFRAPRGQRLYRKPAAFKGPAVDIGVAGRTGLASQDYDQTVVVSGNPGGPLAVAGALAAGPVIGAGVLVLSQLFKGQLQGLTRAYYRITGPWSAPVVQRVSGPSEAEVARREAAAAAGVPPMTVVAAMQMTIGRGRRAQSRGGLAAAARSAGRRAPSLRRCPRISRSWGAPEQRQARGRGGARARARSSASSRRRRASSGLWIVAGTVPLRTETPTRVAAACLVFDAEGRLVRATTRSTCSTSASPAATNATWSRRACSPARAGLRRYARRTAGPRGLLRHPLSGAVPRLGRAGADWVCLPSAFTAPTGRAHWEVLLRARAIENLVHIVAPAQSRFPRERARNLWRLADRRLLGPRAVPAAARHRLHYRAIWTSCASARSGTISRARTSPFDASTAI